MLSSFWNLVESLGSHFGLCLPHRACGHALGAGLASMKHFASMFDAFGAHLGAYWTFRGSFWCHFGVMLVSFRCHFDVIFHSWSASGPSLGLEITFQFFSDHIWHHFGTNFWLNWGPAGAIHSFRLNQNVSSSRFKREFGVWRKRRLASTRCPFWDNTRTPKCKHTAMEASRSRIGRSRRQSSRACRTNAI